ncbi:MULTISPECIES: GNAT family N-acetyltransferase [unclassified Streptomyces]|uniref:GNAT family N-acetyltransferase n=1 Tax=unclassified Streptomyces TaxID=2593676 RepID=UPI00202F4C6D|nr:MULTISPECIES: GNAT family N-acetyltransferase [unclassified Streptomyces]MCM1968658.1 GNAT family N-acetyltransferase [Streptomyces sp. G1]MCX5125011.1 GNAT family N-acetyltransferase [Streptomyces sp. NBC_00347]MCX5299170.1 GNAT family N-acetyltransferase [Streptomyces sp. NBC_00193]
MIFRTATRQDLPAVLALLAQDEDPAGAAADAGAGTVPAPAPPVSEAHERAFAAIAADPRNEMLVLEADGDLVGCLQLTYIPGLGQGGRERALVEAVRIRADRRGGGLGARLMELAAERARERGCGLMQLTSNKRRTAAHRFYERLGYARSHEGFKLPLA